MKRSYNALVRILVIALSFYLVIIFVNIVKYIVHYPERLELNEKVKVGRIVSDLLVITKALQLYDQNVNAYPIEMSQLIQDNVSGWHGPYLPSIWNNPFGNKYEYWSDGNRYFIVTTFDSDKYDTPVKVSLNSDSQIIQFNNTYDNLRIEMTVTTTNTYVNSDGKDSRIIQFTDTTYIAREVRE